MHQPFELLRQAYNNRHSYARQCAGERKKVVGYICDNVPAELIRAAGFIPFRLSGDSARSRSEIADLITPVHARRFAGNEFIEALYAPLAAGELDFLEYLVVPHNRKAVQSVIQSVELLRASAPRFHVPTTHCLDRTYSRSFVTSGYNQASLHRFAAVLEEWRGAPISEVALREAIAQAGRVRAILRSVTALRSSPAPRISGTEALIIYGASHYMDPDEFEATATAFLAEAEARAPLTGLRVYLGGSPLDHPQFYQLVEQSGAIIVAEDHCWGARCAELALDGDVSPLDAIARRFDRQPACSLLGSLDAITQSVVSRMTSSGAEAAIFTVTRGDMAQMWETPSQVEALRALGVPCLHLARQPYTVTDADKLLDQLQAFLSSCTQEQVIG